jgi:CheY-like chemotaxis protein
MRRLTILVADDDPINLEVLNVMLTMEGHRVILVTNGPAAVAQVRENPPDMVFMDGVMPGEYDGLEAIRRMRTEVGYRGVIVLQSANASGVDQQRGLSTGADYYLVKPFKRKEVMQVLDRFASRPSHIR